MSEYLFICVGANALNPTVEMRSVGLTNILPTGSQITSRFLAPEVIECYNGPTPLNAFKTTVQRHCGCGKVLDSPSLGLGVWSLTQAPAVSETVIMVLSLWENSVVPATWISSTKSELKLIARYWLMRQSVYIDKVCDLEKLLADANCRADTLEKQHAAINNCLMSANSTVSDLILSTSKTQDQLIEAQITSRAMAADFAAAKGQILALSGELSAAVDAQKTARNNLAVRTSELNDVRQELMAARRLLTDRVAELDSMRRESPNNSVKKIPKEPAPNNLAAEILNFNMSKLRSRARA